MTADTDNPQAGSTSIGRDSLADHPEMPSASGAPLGHPIPGDSSASAEWRERQVALMASRIAATRISVHHNEQLLVPRLFEAQIAKMFDVPLALIRRPTWAERERRAIHDAALRRRIPRETKALIWSARYRIAKAIYPFAGHSDW